MNQEQQHSQLYDLESLIDLRDFMQDSLYHSPRIDNSVVCPPQRQQVVQQSIPVPPVEPSQGSDPVPPLQMTPLLRRQMAGFNFTINLPNMWINWDLDEVRPPKQKRVKKTKLSLKAIKQTAQCSICLLDMKKNSRIPKLLCTHEFHNKCLKQWMKKQETCPMCRLDLTLSEI